MRLEVEGGRVTFVLSERNLRALLAKLRLAHSRRTIGGRETWVEGQLCQGEYWVRAEPDCVHYVDRPAGRMHPETEELLAREQDRERREE